MDMSGKEVGTVSSLLFPFVLVLDLLFWIIKLISLKNG